MKRLLALSFAAVMVLSACSDDSADTAAETTTTVEGSTESAGSAESETLVCVAGEATPEGSDQVDARGKPEVEVPADPTTSLECTDLIEGSGAEVAEGATVEVHYVGVGQATGEQFDASWDRGESIQFPLSGVIAGWSEGLVGMKEGGRRVLVIPADKAYGDQPPPGSGIQPGETLVFVVDMIATQ